MIAYVALLAAYVFSQFYRAFLAVIAPDLSRDLGLGPNELGQLSAIFFAVFALAQLPIGFALSYQATREVEYLGDVPAGFGAAHADRAAKT